MKFSLKLLDDLADNHKRVLVFDCEFWHVLKKPRDRFYNVPKKQDFFFIAREIGGFVLKKDGDQWDLNDPFFVTLGKPPRDTVLPISHYSTVTPQTGWKLDQIEKRMGIPWGSAFYTKLSTEQQKVYNEGMEIYNSDINIKAHHQDNSWYPKFIELLSESLVIVKGTGDLEALQNAAILYGFKYKKPLDIIDISEWNDESRRLCQTAKLAGTFDCIKKDLDQESKNIADYLPLEKAHDPSTDASMTLLIALYIQSQKP
jgi:hypothetical protein